MKLRFYKELEALERLAALEREHRMSAGISFLHEILRGLLMRHGIEPLPAESQAETLARAAGISARQVRDLLGEQAR